MTNIYSLKPLLIVAALLWAGTAADAQVRPNPVYTPGRLTPSQQVAHDIYKELIEINTSVTTGNITDGAAQRRNARILYPNDTG